jgi:catechol 2,3-dioxygenase-like lactoylglutathione lyase family enzyme
MANHGLLHIALLTRDLKKTERFYTEVLGLKVAFRVAPNMVFFRSPGESGPDQFRRDQKAHFSR